MTTTATMAATSSILILAILAGSLLPSGAQFADPPPPSNETMPDSITVVDVGNDTTAVPEEPVGEMEGEYNQGVEDCIYADSPLGARSSLTDTRRCGRRQASGLWTPRTSRRSSRSSPPRTRPSPNSSRRMVCLPKKSSPTSPLCWRC